MKKEPEVTQNCNRLTMNSSLFPATSTTANNTTASLTKQLFNRDTNADHPMVTKADYDADLKYGIKVFMNNNTIIANNNNNSNTSSNSIASDEDVDDDDYENYEDEVDDNDSGIVTSTTTAVTADRVDMSNRHCGIMANSMAAESDNNDDSNNNDDDSSTSTTTTMTTSNSGSCSSTATATTSKTNHYNNHNGPRKLRFAVGQDVLARWNDGLFYLGNILKVEYQVLFFLFVYLFIYIFLPFVIYFIFNPPPLPPLSTFLLFCVQDTLDQPPSHFQEFTFG